MRTLTILLVSFLVGCNQAVEQASEAPPPGVLVAKAQNRDISETVEYVGRTLAVNDTQLRPQVEGYLLERKFEEGDDIAQGAELFVIDPDLYQAGVAAAEGKVAQTKAALSRATKDLNRYRTLIEKQNVSRQKLDEAESDKLQEQANLKSAEAALQKARIDLSHTVVKAPFSGRIGRSGASVGELVTPQSEPLARLVELDPIYANFSVSERDVVAAKRKLQTKGSGEEELTKLEVRLRLPDGSMYEHVGRLDFIDNVVDRQTGTVVLRARFDNPGKLLVPGLYVSTMLGRQETIEKLVIPQSAVQEDQAGKFVLVVDPEDKVEIRRIEAGESSSGEIVVKSGLNPDERVIVQGIQKVRPGIAVDAKLAPRPEAEKAEADAEDTVVSDEKQSETMAPETAAKRPAATEAQTSDPTTADEESTGGAAAADAAAEDAGSGSDPGQSKED